MTRTACLKWTVLALASVLVTSGRIWPQNSTTKAAVVARMQAETAAWGTLDVAKIKPFYNTAPDAIYFDLSPLEYHGAGTFIDGSLKGLADISAMTLAIRNDAQVHPVGSDTAWATATVDMTTVAKSGKKETMPIRWTSIWQKTGDVWLNVHEHWSQPAP
jgi:ketosteroid isomerase-like protein